METWCIRRWRNFDLVSTSTSSTYDQIIPSIVSQHDNRQMEPLSHQGVDQLMLNNDGRHMTDRYYQNHASLNKRNDQGSSTILHVANPTIELERNRNEQKVHGMNDTSGNQGAGFSYDHGASLDGSENEYEKSEPCQKTI